VRGGARLADGEAQRRHSAFSGGAQARGNAARPAGGAESRHVRSPTMGTPKLLRRGGAISDSVLP